MQRNPIAYVIIMGMTNSILFLTHTINKCCSVKLEGVCAAAKARGWKVNDVEFGCVAWGMDEIISTLRPDGVIFEGGRLNGKVDLIPLQRCPVVYLDTDFDVPPGNTTVRSDAATIARMAADELLASAPTEAVFFTQTPGKSWSRLRERFFRERMRTAGMPFHVLRNASSIAEVRRPFAVFAATDPSAAALLHSAANLGLVCPRDFTLVSVDNNLLFCENSSPKVSSIEQDFFRSGTTAVEALERLFRHGTATGETILIPPKRLVRRASSVRIGSNTTTSQRINAFIGCHAFEDITIADIAAFAGCSRRTAESHFHSAYGYGIGEAILKFRFAEVERLLLDRNQLLEPIANLCGWKSSAHLKRSFKNRYGMTMSDWRQKKRPKA